MAVGAFTANGTCLAVHGVSSVVAASGAATAATDRRDRGEGGTQRTDRYGHRADRGLRGCAVWAGVGVWQGSSVLHERLHWRWRRVA